MKAKKNALDTDCALHSSADSTDTHSQLRLPSWLVCMRATPCTHNTGSSCYAYCTAGGCKTSGPHSHGVCKTANTFLQRQRIHTSPAAPSTQHVLHTIVADVEAAVHFESNRRVQRWPPHDTPISTACVNRISTTQAVHQAATCDTVFGATAPRGRGRHGHAP